MCLIGDSDAVSHEPFIKGLIEHCHSVGEVWSAHEYLHGMLCTYLIHVCISTCFLVCPSIDLAVLYTIVIPYLGVLCTIVCVILWSTFLLNADPEFEESHYYQPTSLPDRKTNRDTDTSNNRHADRDRGRKCDKPKQGARTATLSKEESEKPKTKVSSCNPAQSNQEFR